MPSAGHAGVRPILTQECYLPKELLVSTTAPEAAQKPDSVKSPNPTPRDRCVEDDVKPDQHCHPPYPVATQVALWTAFLFLHTMHNPAQAETLGKCRFFHITLTNYVTWAELASLRN